MGQVYEDEMLHFSPYAMQIERFANSLKELSQAFLGLEDDKKSFTRQEVEAMIFQVKEQVCEKCEKYDWCWRKHDSYTYQMGYEILSAIESYGDELSVEIKRKIEAKCIQAPRYVRTMAGTYRDAMRNVVWKKRIASNREGCAIQLEMFADMIRSETKELEDSIVADTRIQKKLETELQKIGAKVLYSTILLNSQGRYEIYITACAQKGKNISYQEIAQKVSLVMGKRMVAQDITYGTLQSDYSTTIFTEGAFYYTMYGTAKIGKKCEQISGDNFMKLDLPGGKQCIALSDGMGAGERANKESELVINLLEDLLKAGYPENTAIQMLNTAIVIGREEIRFSTIDLCSLDLYTGRCRMWKAGASTTFIKRTGSVEKISSSSLPIGVVQRLSVDKKEIQLNQGDFIIMITDGIMDALPALEQDIILETIIKGTNKNNAKEMAHHILEQILEWTGREPKDDMTVLVASLWRFA